MRFSEDQAGQRDVVGEGEFVEVRLVREVIIEGEMGRAEDSTYIPRNDAGVHVEVKNPKPNLS